MKVSILITTYNLEKYIAWTLKSVLKQRTSFEYEILVGDDGSNDDTVNIIKDFIEDNPGRISLFQMPREDGVSYNRVERSAANRLNLLENAKGDYVSFLDGDDFYVSRDRVQIMADELDVNKDAVMCMHNLVMHYGDDDDNPMLHGTPLCRAKKKHVWGIKDYWPLVFVQANGLMFRNIFRDESIKKDLLENKALANNFDDNNITYWLLKYGKMIYIPECLGAYRQVNGSSWNGIDEFKQNVSNILGFAIEKSVKVSDESLARHYVNIKYLYEHRSEISKEACMPFYETASKYDMQYALSIYNYGCEGGISDDAFWKLYKKCEKEYKKAKLRRVMAKAFGKY